MKKDDKVIKSMADYMVMENQFDHKVVDLAENNRRILEVQNVKTSAAIGLGAIALCLSIMAFMRR